uniref:Uncharacterized protein n=1 Tax=Anolis carolinensis TaxID=28377 RepID=A0A803TW14_ANOCA
METSVLPNRLSLRLPLRSSYSKKHNTPRDIVIRFSKKKTRDDILLSNSKTPTFYKGERIAILKELPISILERRRKYLFLTDELKKRNIRFRWDRIDGLMLTWEGLHK